MEILDDFGRIEKIDKSGMLRVVEAFPKQCSDAVSLAKHIRLKEDYGGVTRLAVLGMGGSGIGADLLKTVVESQSELPVTAVKGYDLPRHVRSDTLVFAVSYSGDTEETLSAFTQALDRGARIIAITSGGSLHKQALEHGLAFVEVPAGYQPRAALGFLFLPMLMVLDRLGLIDPQKDAILETLTILQALSERYSWKQPSEDNLAKRVAGELLGKVPVIYGSDGLTAPAALRWKCQLNENSKVPAFWSVFPELNHNEIVGWELLKDFTQDFSLVLLRDREEHSRVARRMDITRELVSAHVGKVHELWCEGNYRLAKILSILYLGDFVSVYLALLNKVDPTPVERISLLKKRLAES